jgi:hypothetical protein
MDLKHLTFRPKRCLVEMGYGRSVLELGKSVGVHSRHDLVS